MHTNLEVPNFAWCMFFLHFMIKGSIKHACFHFWIISWWYMKVLQWFSWLKVGNFLCEVWMFYGGLKVCYLLNFLVVMRFMVLFIVMFIVALITVRILVYLFSFLFSGVWECRMMRGWGGERNSSLGPLILRLLEVMR